MPCPNSPSTLTDNLKSCKFRMHLDPQKLVMESLPGAIRSIVIWASCRDEHEDTVVFVFVLVAGVNRHPNFLETEEPHQFKLTALLGHIYNYSKNKITFVKDKHPCQMSVQILEHTFTDQCQSLMVFIFSLLLLGGLGCHRFSPSSTSSPLSFCSTFSFSL